MLKYALGENLLTERPDDYTAQVIPGRSYSRSEIIDRMLQRGTLVTKTDVVAVLNNFEEVITDILTDGDTVNLPLFNTSFSISGVFEGVMDTFDSNRHKLNINLTKGTLLRDAEKQVRFTKTEASSPIPNIVEVKDVVSGTINSNLTPGGVVQLWGSLLKLAGDDPEVGLWFVPETGAPLKAEVIVTNKPASLIAMIPATLPAGSYTLRVVTQYSGGLILKTPKVNVFNRTLTVG